MLDIMSTTTMTPSERWLAGLLPDAMAHFMAQTPEVQVRTLDALDGLADKLARMFVGVCDRTGHAPGWIMPVAEWEAHGSPRTGSAWEALL